MTRPRLLSGVPGLDPVLNGGFSKSGAYIFQGKPGAGKTILANQICFAHVARGGKSAYVTLLTESIPRMFENLGLIRLLRGEIKDRKPSILVLDGMTSASAKAESRIELRKFIHDLQGYASAFQCTVFLLGTTDSEAAIQVEHTMVEGLIDLTDTSLNTQSQRSLQVRKLRGSNYIGGRHAFSISDAGVEVLPRLERAFAEPLGNVDGRGPLATGIAGFDQLSGVGGLRSSSSTLLAGPVGTGARLPESVSSMPALFDNLIILRSIEIGSSVQRYLSGTKMRGCDYDDSIHEYAFDKGGLSVAKRFRQGSPSGNADLPAGPDEP